MTTIPLPYRVVVSTPAPVAKEFADRISAEAYREHLKGIVRNPSRLEHRVEGSWIDVTEPEGHS